MFIIIIIIYLCYMYILFYVYMRNMKATRAAHGLLRVCVLSWLAYLLSSTCATCGAAASAHQHHHHQQHQHQQQHHRPLTEEQKADQNLQFMLSLYRSAAEPDGRPKQHRKFGSNTVRLLRPSASSVRHLPASPDHRYSFTVQYNLDTVPSEQLIRASFIHLRSAPSSSTRPLHPPRCRAQITSLGKASLVTLEPHERWTETDITAHVRRGKSRGPPGGHLTLTAQYWCREGGGGLSGWRFPLRRGAPHLEVPSLLLYVEEEREGKDWMGDLLGVQGENITRRPSLPPPPPPPATRRRRRSKDPSPPDPKDTSLDVLKNAPTYSSSFSTSASVIPDIPPSGSGRRAGGAAPKSRCKLHSFRLSFDELGWGHYFIAPPVYNPRFCQGNCPRVLSYGFHSPNHAIIQTVISDLGVGDVPPPSCVPYKYMPMSVLVVHKKKVEYRELEDMVAESCTCR
ncbi:bone morphogenetic protein 15 [Pungitius pungitius]|uniref:bone morphogenetic protein 15 n=1 Tax=Pungitius pungitius TaxID=134920 RepID=UPI002E144888